MFWQSKPTDFHQNCGSPGSVCAKHTLHLASDISGYVTGPETGVRFAMGSADRNHVTQFEKRFRYLPGRRAGADWNFETAKYDGASGQMIPYAACLKKNGTIQQGVWHHRRQLDHKTKDGFWTA
jgi:type VI secretion system secreted protein VgrG